MPCRQWHIDAMKVIASHLIVMHDFAMIILANALWVQLEWGYTSGAAVVTLLAWLVCVAADLLFARFVERPLMSVRLGAGAM
jgi:hypothetical protein